MYLRFFWPPLVFLLFLFLVSLAAQSRSADLYRWLDERGVVHFSDNEHNIPPEFRENVTRIRGLSPSKPSNNPAFTGRASVPLIKKGLTAVVEARINSTTKANFIVDTGASYTVISEHVARELKIDLEKKHPKIRLQTANGVIEVPLVTLDSIEISGLRVDDLAAAVHDFSKDTNIAGLLGLNFLGKFRMDLDTEKGVLVLEKK
jgi:clan AA aspartic protease (TIGR02281 family)